MAAVEALCSRAVRISEGAFVQDGQPQDVIRGYQMDSSSVRMGEYRADCTNEVIQAVTVTGARPTRDAAIQEGDAVVIQLSVRPDAIHDTFTVTLGIDDALNQRMLTLRCCPAQEIRGDSSTHDQVTCEIAEIPLAANRYTLGVVCHNGTEIVDVRVRALQFDVQPNPQFYTRGQHRRGLCVAKAEWKSQKSHMSRHAIER